MATDYDMTIQHDHSFDHLQNKGYQEIYQEV